WYCFSKEKNLTLVEFLFSGCGSGEQGGEGVVSETKRNLTTTTPQNQFTKSDTRRPMVSEHHTHKDHGLIHTILTRCKMVAPSFEQRTHDQLATAKRGTRERGCNMHCG
ncbi:hypothetical protein BaRGS_00007263, partial [Batillaria attramentaria]